MSSLMYSYYKYNLNMLLRILFTSLFSLTLVYILSSQINDTGIPVNVAEAQSFNWNTSAMAIAPGSGICPPDMPMLSSFSGGNTQTGRILRSGNSTICPSNAYPGKHLPTSMLTLLYETYTYPNTSNTPACVSINFDPNMGTTPCGTNAHLSAYLGSYDPANQDQNYLGDSGNSGTSSFSVEIPGGEDLVLVINSNFNTDICDFAFEVVGLPCVEPSNAIPTMGEWGLICLCLSMLIFTCVSFKQSIVYTSSK